MARAILAVFLLIRQTGSVFGVIVPLHDYRLHVLDYSIGFVDFETPAVFTMVYLGPIGEFRVTYTAREGTLAALSCWGAFATVVTLVSVLGVRVKRREKPFLRWRWVAVGLAASLVVGGSTTFLTLGFNPIRKSRSGEHIFQQGQISAYLRYRRPRIEFVIISDRPDLVWDTVSLGDRGGVRTEEHSFWIDGDRQDEHRFTYREDGTFEIDDADFDLEKGRVFIYSTLPEPRIAQTDWALPDAAYFEEACERLQTLLDVWESRLHSVDRQSPTSGN